MRMLIHAVALIRSFSGTNANAATDAASIAIAPERAIIVPTCTLFAYLVTTNNPANINPIPPIVARALVRSFPSIILRAAIAPAIISIDVAKDRIIRLILPALIEFSPINFVAAIKPTIIPAKALIAKVPLTIALRSMLPNILTARAINSKLAPMPSIALPKLDTSLDILSLSDMAIIIIPRNVVTARPP